MSASLESRREGRALRLTLNRPEKRNALNAALCRELVDRFAEADDDREVGAILIEARGPVFCAGMDLDEAVLPDAAEQTAIHELLFTTGSRIHKPIVAAVAGPALAGGTGLVANAHVVVAADSATFGLTEIRIGMWPFVVYRAVAQALGDRRTLELSLTGRIFGAAEALDYGLVHQVVAVGEVDVRASEIAQGLAAWSPEIVRRGLDFVAQSRGLPSTEAGALAAQMRARNFRSPDFLEGVRALREKRKARWPSVG